MSKWQRQLLGDLIDVKHGFAFKGEYFASEGEKLVLKPGNFPIGGGIRLRPGKDDYYAGTYPEEFELSPGDLLVVMTDLTQAAPILGSPAFVPEQPAMLHNQRLGLVTIKPDVELDRRFLYYLLLSDSSRSQLRATATGATVRHTAPERIYRVTVAVPGPKVQQVIGAILGAIDDLIENQQRRIHLLGEVVKAIYQEWFVRFRFPGFEANELSESDGGPIPAGWGLSTVGNELRFHGGATPSKANPVYWDGGDIPWYTPSDLTKSRTRFAAPPEASITSDGLRGSSARLFPSGSLLMTSRATLGVLAVATTPATCNQGFIVILPDDRWPPSFMYEWLSSQASSLEALGTGATFKEITKRAFKDVPFVVPDEQTLAKFRHVVDPLDREIRALEAGCRCLKEIRDLLLPKLVTGQIDISEFDLDAIVEMTA